MNDATSVAPRAESPAKARRVLWLTVSATAVLIVVAAAAFLLISRELHAGRTSYSDARHARATLDQLRLVFSSLQDAETGAQGYVLAGNEEFLSPYYAAERSLEAQLQRLTQLAAEDESQQIAQELVPLARAQLSFVGDVVATRRSRDAAAAIELLRGGVGKRQMDRIRELTAAFELHEGELLQQRRDAFELRSERTEAAVRIALTTAILLMLAAGGLLVWPIDPSRLLDAIHNVLLELRGRRARILHVEDDESLSALVEELLSEEAEVVRAHSLAQARAHVEAERFDLVILDVALGDGSGLDLLPMLREAGSDAPPVILYSASEPSRDLSERVEAALVKSRDSVEHLLATVRRLASRPGAEQASA